MCTDRCHTPLGASEHSGLSEPWHLQKFSLDFSFHLIFLNNMFKITDANCIVIQPVTLKNPLIILSLTYRLNHPSMNRLHDAVNDSPEVVFLS